MAAVGKGFGLSLLQSVRAGLLLAAGGEFAFVTFGEAVSHKILPQALVSKLFLIVSLSMALTPFLAEFGQRLGKMFEKSDVKVGSETELFVIALVHKLRNWSSCDWARIQCTGIDVAGIGLVFKAQQFV